MTDTRKLQRDFLELLDPGEPQHGCTALAQHRESQYGDAGAETIREIILDPLDWYIQSVWEKYGPNFCGLHSANAFRLAADDIRYRFANQQMICIEKIEALERKWVAFQAVVGYNRGVLLEVVTVEKDRLTATVCEMENPARIGNKIKKAASAGHAAVHGTIEEKEHRWKKYRTDCVNVWQENKRLGLTAVRQTVADMNCVSLRTVQRYTKDLEDLLKYA